MRIIKFLVVLGLVLAVLGGGLAALAYWHFNRDLPDYQQLADYEPPIVTRVHAGDGRLLAEYASERRIFVPIGDIPLRVVDAFLAIEDKHFYSHPGIDLPSIVRAAFTNFEHVGSNRRPVGASTITQQVAKNFLLTNEVSLERKIKEALLALRIEQALSKDRILELYLNEIYLGGGAYGVAAAALNYFNKSLDELSVEDAAFLAALPKAPNNYNPQRFPEAAKARRDLVLSRMREDGYITAEQEAVAVAAPITTRRREETELIAAPYFAEEVRRELLQRYGDKGLYQAGLSVRTSLDPDLQAIAERSLRAGLISYDRRHGWRGPIARLDAPVQDWSEKLTAIALPPGAGDWRLAVVLSTDGEGAAIGLADGARGRIPFAELRWARPELPDQHVGPLPKLAADVVKPGDVILVEKLPGDAKQSVYALRMAGGYSYEMSQFNRATQAKRQPGSSFKPFVYLTALENGFTPSTLILDAPFVADQGPGLPKWKPTNYNTTSFNGPTPLRVGVEQSKNMMTARLGAVVGLDKVAQTVETFGILDHMPLQYAMLLGAGETTPLRLATAYAMLVNGGKRITPSFIDRVQDRNGKTIARADTRSCQGCSDVEWHGQAPPELPDIRETVVDAASAYQIVSILQGVVERGTGRVVSSIGKPLAGKTGTTNDYQDNWFMGFSPDLVAGVYVGFDNPRTLGEREEGAHNAAPIFRDFMAAALKDKPATAFRIPPGIRLVRVNAATGQLARPGDRTVIYEAFKPGTEPNGDNMVVSGQGIAEPGAAAMPTGASGGGGSYSVPVTGTGGLY